MTEGLKESTEHVASIFNKLNREKILEFQVNEKNILQIQRDIINMYRAEKKFNALKVFEVTSSSAILEPKDLEAKVLDLSIKQDFLSSDQYDDFSVFPHTDGDAFCKVSFAGFTKFEMKDYDEGNQVVFTPYKKFVIFKASIFKNYKTGKVYVFLKFNNRRRHPNNMNFFNIETEFVKGWFRDNFDYRLKAIDVRDIYYRHSFDKTKFEQIGYNVSDILDDSDSTLPVELKFRPNDRNLKPEDIYSQVNKVVLPGLNEKIFKICEDVFGKADQKARGKLEFELKALNFSKQFFESAHKAFENGVGHLKYLLSVEDYDKPIVYRFDFPADENGVIKLEILDSGKYMNFIYDEINRYLDAQG